MNFCPNCGTPVGGGRKFCSECGMALGAASNTQTRFQNAGFNQSNSKPSFEAKPRTLSSYENGSNVLDAYSLVGELAHKVWIEGIIWLVIGIAQIIFSLTLLNVYSDEMHYLIYAIIMIVVGVVNLYGARNSLNNAKILETYPRGIVDAYGDPSEVTGSLVYNLLVGGLIGVIGSLYEISVRQHVKCNALRYNEAERIILEHKASM